MTAGTTILLLLAATFSVMAVRPQSLISSGTDAWVLRMVSVLGFLWVGLALSAGAHRNPLDLPAATVTFLMSIRHYLGGIIVGILLGYNLRTKGKPK